MPKGYPGTGPHQRRERGQTVDVGLGQRVHLRLSNNGRRVEFVSMEAIGSLSVARQSVAALVAALKKVAAER